MRLFDSVKKWPVTQGLDLFVELKFYPPASTDEYVDQVPAKVQATIFNSSNLSSKGYESREGFKLLIRAYCDNPNHPAQQELLNGFWDILKTELIKHYKKEDLEEELKELQATLKALHK